MKVIHTMTNNQNTNNTTIQIQSHTMDKRDVLIQNGGQSNGVGNVISSQGFEKYTKLVNDPSILAGYNASRNKKQFVIDNVIDTLLNEGRKFYINERGHYKYLDLRTDHKIKWTFADKVSQKVRDCKKRLLRTSNKQKQECKNNTKRTKSANEVNSTKEYVPSLQPEHINNNDKIAASKALLTLRESNNSNVQGHKCNVQDKDVIKEAIFIAMNNHKSNSKIQENGCVVLNNLAVSNAEHIRTMNKSKQEIEAIVTAMTTHPTNVIIQQSGCERLKSIACS